MNDELQLYYQPPEVKIVVLNGEDVIRTSKITDWVGDVGDFSGEYGTNWE